MDERALVDAGPLTALYNANDYHHREIFSFFQNTNVEHFITTDACIAEVMHNLKRVSVLDRRRFELELIDGQPEQFRASSRNKINS